MSAVDQDSLAVLAMTNRLVDAGVPALKASELWRVLEVVPNQAVDEPRVAEPAPSPRGLTGVCWCGCGKEVEAGAFFLPRHAPGAAQRAVLRHFGGVEEFLVILGEAPSGNPN